MKLQEFFFLIPFVWNKKGDFSFSFCPFKFNYVIDKAKAPPTMIVLCILNLYFTWY